MIHHPQLLHALEGICPSELNRFRHFLDTHSISELEVEGIPVQYCVCGRGDSTILTFVAGWGGIEMAYDTVLAFEETSRMMVVDISPFEDPDATGDAINQMLDREGIGRVVVVGQSLSGILAQLYVRRHPSRVQGLVLTNTLMPRPERCRRWPLVLFRCLPIRLLRPLILRRMSRLQRLERQLPPEVEERRRFANALIIQLFDRSFTRQRIERILRLAWRFNQEGAYRPDELSAWTCQVLLVTSEDDPYHEDATTLASTLPAAELFMLPTGYGHTAPQIHREQFQAEIRSFIDRLTHSTEKRNPPRPAPSN